MLEPNTYSLVNYDEAEKVVADYEALAAQVEVLNQKLPPEYRDAFARAVRAMGLSAAG